MSGTRRFLLATSIVAAAALASTSAHAAPVCTASKLKAAGKDSGSKLRCHSKAAKANTAVDPACLAKSSDKLALAFSKAESNGGCGNSGDAIAVEARIDTQVNDVVAAIPLGVDDDSRVCASKKLTASSKKSKGRLICYSKAEKKDEAVDPACLQKAEDKFVAAFGKADSAGGCAVTGDAAAVEVIVDDGVASIVAEVIPTCGDNIVNGAEQCDGTDDVACPGECVSSCVCAGDCGNGVVEIMEECDDGNNTSGDGCRDDCVLEDASALCAGVSTTAGTTLDKVLVDTFSSPVLVTAAPLDPRRIFVVEQGGFIRIVKDNVTLPTEFLDIDAKVKTSGEQGLLGLAFHPDYETNGFFFVAYTDNSDDQVLARYEVSNSDPDVADAGSEEILLTIDDPYGNHNGGMLAFGPDGYLYWGMGDGGSGSDPDETGQDDTTLLGKMMRIDVDVAVAPFHAVPPDNPNAGDGLPLGLIWSKGLRNPWRFSFDRGTGDIYIGDVGQGSLEEIDYEPASSTGGVNWGWDIFEGTSCHEPEPPALDCPDPPTGFTFPIHEYSHGVGCSITGGYVYRGCSMPDLAGRYFYSDFCTPFVDTFVVSGGVATSFVDKTTELGAGLSSISSYGEDARGEIYIVSHDGSVWRIIPN